MRRWFFVSISLPAIFLSPLFSAPNPYKIPDALDENIRKTFSQLFNQDFEAADATLAEIKPQSGKHPMAALVKVIRMWWAMSADVMEIDEAESKKFTDAADECIKLAEHRMKKGDPTAEARLVIGTTIGLMSRWSAANRAWIPAYLRGRKSVEYMEKTLKKNPLAIDAYMTLGTFNYAKTQLSKQSDEDDKEAGDDSDQEGIDQLEKAYREGTYFKIPSGMLLAGILTNDKPERALPLLKELRESVPNSGFLRIIEITALFNAGHNDELDKASIDFMNAVATNTYPATFKPQAYFGLGLAAFKKKDWKLAADDFEMAIENGNEENPYFTWAHLYEGYCFDAMKERSKAKARYEEVLKLKRRFASHDHARERLDVPFTPRDPEMKKVEL